MFIQYYHHLNWSIENKKAYTQIAYGRNILLRCIGLSFIINLQIAKFRVKVRERNVNKFLWYFLFNIFEIFTKIFTTSNILYCVCFFIVQLFYSSELANKQAAMNCIRYDLEMYNINKQN